MDVISRCYSVSSLSHNWKDKTFQTLKIDGMADMIDFGEFLSFSLENLSLVTSIQYVCYLYEENKSGSSENELHFRMLTMKKFSGDCLLSTLVIHLCRALLFFHQYLFNIFF